MFEKALVSQFCSRIQNASFVVEFWDQDRRCYGSGTPQFVIRFGSRNTLVERY